jgi:aspartyl-tRNA(Asn)/glutamyl-tRNA(Gln) amidotransferase subunit A
MKTVRELAEELALGRASAASLVEDAVARIEDPGGEGSKVFVRVNADQARRVASSYDDLRAQGLPVPAFAGIPLAAKDLFDVAGEVTTAGSVVLADEAPAPADSVAVARLRRAGFVVIGRANMTEFAYSGLGLNAHYGTPAAALDRSTRRIPGGSSSGSAVAVADGMAAVGLGTDTGGSCRIPAAFNGLVGFKPTASRVPTEGCFPLSFSLDSIGPIGRSVDCCALLDDLLTGGSGTVDQTRPPADRVRLGVLQHLGFDDLDAEVAAGVDGALTRLGRAGVGLVEAPFPELADLASYYAGGGLIAAEAYAGHQDRLESAGDRYDQRVRTRIENGKRLTASDYIGALQGRRRLIAAAQQRSAGIDAFVLPTVAITPPPIAAYDTGDAHRDAAFYTSTNLAALRNTSIANFLDTCAISVPTASGPVGLMLIGKPGDDDRLLSVARTVEAALR